MRVWLLRAKASSLLVACINFVIIRHSLSTDYLHSNLVLGAYRTTFNDTDDEIYPVGNWPQRGSDLSYEKGIINITELNCIAMTPDGNRIVVGEGDVGKITIYDYSVTQTEWEIEHEIALGGRFGKSVDISSDGNRFVVGKYDEANYTGFAQVYEYDSRALNWTQLGSDIYGDEDEEWSGYSVSISGNGQRIAVGSPFKDINSDELNSGMVRVFEWDVEELVWTKFGEDIIGDSTGDRSGSKVVISEDGGSVAIVATHNDGEDENGTSTRNSGQVRVYTYTCETFFVFSSSCGWTQKGDDIDGLTSYIGNPLDMDISSDGEQVIVGYPSYSNDRGQVIAYKYVGLQWTVIGNVLEGEAEGHLFGYGVSMSSDGLVVMVAAPGAVNSTHSGVGFIYQYNGATQTWIFASSDNSTECFTTAISDDYQIVATMSVNSTQIFKFQKDTPFPSMAPTKTPFPSNMPSISMQPSVSTLPTVNNGAPSPPIPLFVWAALNPIFFSFGFLISFCLTSVFFF